MGRAGKDGLEATRLAVMDAAGDVWYGAQCYTVAYKEQCQQAIGAWARKTKVTYWSASGAGAGGAKGADWCSLDEETRRQALDRARSQALQKVGSRARAVREVKEHRAMVHMVQRRVRQRTGARAQAVREMEEQLEEKQGQHRETIRRWWNGSHGEGLLEAAVEMPSPAEENREGEALPQYETNTVAYNSGPETTEEPQLGDKPEVEYKMQRDDGLEVTVEGRGSEDEWEVVRHVWQEKQRVPSEKQVEGRTEATKDETRGGQCQEKAPKGLLFRTDEERASMAVIAARSLADEGAVSMLLQSTVVAESESKRHYKAEQKKQAQDKVEAQWERDSLCPAWGPEEAHFDCHMTTVEMQAAGESEVAQQEWHEVQEMPQDQVPAAARWELEKRARRQQPQQRVGHKAEAQVQEQQAREAAQGIQKDQGLQDEESNNWSKVGQAAEAAAIPQNKSKKAHRKLLDKIQAWGVQAHGTMMAGSGSNQWVCIGTMSWCRSSRHCHGFMVG